MKAVQGPAFGWLALVALLVSGCASLPPSGAVEEEGAVLIPRMDPPLLDRALTPGEWDAALRLEGTFVIADGSAAAGEYPFQAWVGGDERNLYVAAEVRAGRNPWSRVVVGETGGYQAGSIWYPDDLCLFFTNGLTGNLTVPSDVKCFSNKREQGTSNGDGYWNGRAWVWQPEAMGGNHAFNEGRPDGGTWGRGGYTNETLVWEIYVPRTPLYPAHDGLRIGRGEAFRMALAFVRQGPAENRTSSLESPRDTFPGPGHTPDGLLSPQTWMGFRLDP